MHALPPTTTPIPDSVKPPSLVGALLSVLGLGMASIGLFALPLQRYGPDEPPPYHAIGFTTIHDLVGTDNPYSLGTTQFASTLARFWWGMGALLLVGLLVTITAIVCVARSRPVLRVTGLCLSLIAIGTGVLFGLALRQTTDFRNILRARALNPFGRPAPSMYHDSGLGPWIAFAGFAALVLGGLFTVVANRERAARG